VRDTLDLEVAIRRGPVIKQQYGATAPGKELFQRKDLPAVPQWIARKEAHFGKRVEDNSRRLKTLDFVGHRFCDVTKFDF
jgi:hypothetical protein